MDLSFEEWSELVALEVPSIWGLAVAKADVLDDSEPTFPSEESGEECTESEPATVDPSEGSCIDYSPSPVRFAPHPPLPGFNLDPPLVPFEADVYMSPSESMAAAALGLGWISEPDIMRLVCSLPTCTRPFQHSAGDGRCACLFTTGAYIRGPMTGVMNNTINYPAVTALISAIVRSAAPDALFSAVSIILNVSSDVHRDVHNHVSIPNTLVRLSEFSHGALWLEEAGGPITHQGLQGVALELERPFVQFDPRRRHGTLSWSGDRLMAAAFHIRQPELLSHEDRRTRSHAGFRLA